MFNQSIGVSPPPKGKAQDSKVDLKKDFNETSKGQYKSDFEKALKEKLAVKQKEKKEAEQNEHLEAKLKKPDKELKAEEKDKKSSGGTKKKMTEKCDDQMISNNMASIENEVEIPESKIDLAQILENHDELEIVKLDQPQKGIDLKAFDLPAQDLAAASLEKLTDVNNQLTIEQTQAKAYTFEKELSDQVGYQSEADSSKPSLASSELVQKMKSFEVEKNLTADKAQAFEKSVLDQLQKIQSTQVEGAAQAKTSDKGDQQTQGDDFSQKNLKSDQMNSADLMHAGQSHGDFKAQLGAAPMNPAAELSHMNRLEENHDQNVREIMNQAKYLVTQGGGEMSVKMSPDGLAEVQLKVVLLDGKVNIEMHTQDKAVKKLIEDSLSELKSGLAAQHLSIEHVKINSVSATNTDNSAQFQSNWNQSSSENKQREFWNQVQDSISQNNSRHANYSSVSGVARPSSVYQPVATTSSSPRTYGGTKGSQINRVA